MLPWKGHKRSAMWLEKSIQAGCGVYEKYTTNVARQDNNQNYYKHDYYNEKGLENPGLFLFQVLQVHDCRHQVGHRLLKDGTDFLPESACQACADLRHVHGVLLLECCVGHL